MATAEVRRRRVGADLGGRGCYAPWAGEERRTGAHPSRMLGLGGDDLLTDIEPRVKARAQQLIEQVGEDEFRRGVAQFTRWHIDTMTLDEVIGLYVMARRGRVLPPEAGRRAVEIYPTLPDRTDDDAGFTLDGRKVTVEEWVAWRTARLEGRLTA